MPYGVVSPLVWPAVARPGLGRGPSGAGHRLCSGTHWRWDRPKGSPGARLARHVPAGKWGSASSGGMSAGIPDTYQHGGNSTGWLSRARADGDKPDTGPSRGGR